MLIPIVVFIRLIQKARDNIYILLMTMARFLYYFKGSKAKEPVDYICAFIPQPILEHIETAEGIDQETRLSVRSTIEASKETVKEREDVADGDKNPHEPDLPGETSNKQSKAGPQRHRIETHFQSAIVNVYDGLNSDYTHLPGPLLRQYGQGPVADGMANECYDAMNLAQAFFRDVYGWDSLDDKNIPLVATVHYGWNVANAFFFSKYKQMVYGNGNPHMYGFARSYDVIGHELTHGIIQFSSGMVYKGMSGALNEHCADVFGALLEQYVQKQTADQADWLLAQDVLFPETPTIAMRSLKAPGTAYDDPRVGKDTQPSHMKNYLNTAADNGGVHTNSGIPNHAFYLAATRQGGYAWERAGKTWFAAMTSSESNPTFYTFARRTIEEAKKFNDDNWVAIVQASWYDVGVFIGPNSWFSWLWKRK